MFLLDHAFKTEHLQKLGLSRIEQVSKSDLIMPYQPHVSDFVQESSSNIILRYQGTQTIVSELSKNLLN